MCDACADVGALEEDAPLSVRDGHVIWGLVMIPCPACTAPIAPHPAEPGKPWSPEEDL